MAEENNKIEIRSSEVQEILGGVPSWIVRFGIFILLAVFTIIIIATFVFKYPDVIRSKIVVTTENPPADLVARYTGKIEALFVSDNEKVKIGQVVALIQNPADYNDIQKLNVLIDSIQPVFDSIGFVVKPTFDRNLQLGTIQEYYSQFLKKYDELLVFVEQNYYPRMNESLKDQLSMAEILYDRLWQQKEAVENEYNIKLRQYERQKTLIAREVISSTDLEVAESEVLGQR